MGCQMWHRTTTLKSVLSVDTKPLPTDHGVSDKMNIYVVSHGSRTSQQLHLSTWLGVGFPCVSVPGNSEAYRMRVKVRVIDLPVGPT